MLKARGGIAAVAVSLLWLSGCNEQMEDEPRVVEEVPSDAVVEQTTSEPERALIEVEFSLHAELRTDRRLMVEGTSNLPDGTRVQVIVEREISRVRWQSRTTISEGQFTAGPFGSGSGLPDGGYLVQVQSSEGSVQPQTVQDVIGREGENLSGELVTQTRHGLGQVATYSRRFLVGSEPRRTRDQVDVIEE
ncbi:hypothetical protein RN346_11995 [Halomonas sp. PAMB 3232]|uniref:hypothetical protein n=1 Tax=Halomonas sp. PAMB 3232 TaxID=3075221 RepID=UPI0028A086DD|nr:hypothetical protein [Halomonas sp. PAMB 3232]WNL38010.1 hypothetical protein RN346_11995 [Halomonas sp. PAMB 3232]